MPTPSSRIHEPIALGALVAAALALHALWIGNLLVMRIPAVAQVFDLFPPLGPVSGLYDLVAIIYVVVFAAVALHYRGRDCSHARDGAFWLFVSSLVAFTVLTLPFVAGSSLLAK